MQRVLVLGATSAIAAEVVLIHASRGDALALVGRNAEKLEALARRASEHASACHAFVADLDATAGNATLVNKAIESLGGVVDIAILAHGLLGDQAETERDWDAAGQVLQTNLLSAVSLLIPLAQHFSAQSHGAIGVLSSVAGDRGRPRNYTYGAAKAGLTAYLQGLRSRLWRVGVRVHTFKLGPVDTPMTAGHEKNRFFAAAPDVAARIVADMAGPAGEFYVPRYWALILGVIQRMPEPLLQRLRFLMD